MLLLIVSKENLPTCHTNNDISEHVSGSNWWCVIQGHWVGGERTFSVSRVESPSLQRNPLGKVRFWGGWLWKSYQLSKLIKETFSNEFQLKEGIPSIKFIHQLIAKFNIDSLHFHVYCEQQLKEWVFFCTLSFLSLSETFSFWFFQTYLVIFENAVEIC